MLGFQYVVAKSRELSSALDRELSSASNRSTPFESISSLSLAENAASNTVPVATNASTASSPCVRNEGHLFLRTQQKLGQELDAALSHARATLQAQAVSEHFLCQNFHLVSRVRQQLAGVRALVLKLAQETEEVESLLVQRCEETAAQQNAAFAAKQQQELEKFEAIIAKESEGRKRELLEMRRQKLANAFLNDLKTYQTLLAYHGDAGATEARLIQDKDDKVTLDEVDLVVTTDPEQLDAFYDSTSEHEEEEAFKSRPLMGLMPKELEEEEEKREDAGDEEKSALDLVDRERRLSDEGCGTSEVEEKEERWIQE